MSLFLIATIGFAISRKEFKLGKIYAVLIILPMFFSGGLAASYAVNTQLLGLKNTVFAQIDGASFFAIFGRFVIPMSKPILVTIGLFEAFAYWNTWYDALLYIDSGHSSLYPLQYLLYIMQSKAEFASSSQNVTGVIEKIPTESFRMALVVLIIAPILVTYPFFHKFFVKGLTSGIGK